jgi:hypothetical protein
MSGPLGLVESQSLFCRACARARCIVLIDTRQRLKDVANLAREAHRPSTYFLREWLVQAKGWS